MRHMRFIAILIAFALPVGVFAAILLWVRPHLFWPSLKADDSVEVIQNGAAVRFQCIRQTREIWAEVAMTHGGCVSSSCLKIIDARSSAWVNPLNGDINVLSRFAYTDLGRLSRDMICTSDCGVGLGEVQQVYLGVLQSGVHNVWIGDTWAGYIEIKPPPVPAHESCLKLWYPITPTPPATYTPVYPPSSLPAISYPAPDDGNGTNGTGYP